MILSNCKVFLSLDKSIDLVDKIAALVLRKVWLWV